MAHFFVYILRLVMIQQLRFGLIAGLDRKNNFNGFDRDLLLQK